MPSSMRAWTMSSETSTEHGAFRPWHFFALAGLAGASVAVYYATPSDAAALVLLVAAVGSGAYVGYAAYGMLLPLVTSVSAERTEMVGGRTRAALDREKTLVLRSIKELEFDRAMGKVSDADFNDVGTRLRARAKSLLQQLDVEGQGYRDRIEQELAARLAQTDAPPPAAQARYFCARCGTSNEPDAKFCKRCGASVADGPAAAPPAAPESVAQP
jgi:hypothetical protein